MGWNEIDRAASLVRRTPILIEQRRAIAPGPARQMLATVAACAAFAIMGAGIGATLADPPAIIPVAEASEHILSIRFEHEADALAFHADRQAEGESVCLTFLPLEQAARHWVHSC